MKTTLIATLTLIMFVSVSCKTEHKNNIDVEKLIQKITIEEKLDFIGGFKSFSIRGYEHLGIPEIRFADGPVGVRGHGASTAYAASISLAASWDKEMAYKVGKAIGAEARAKNIHVMLGPGMNIYRSPLCGRNFEYLGEDPYLAGQIAKEYVIGMQNEGVIATAKHFVANNQEFNRRNCSSDMDERTLHEIYLPAFKTTVQEGKVAAVMTSYNLINGVHASENNYLNNQILKGDWGFDGFIMSDWESTYNGVACAKGGLDLEMPSGKLMNPDILGLAIKNGELNESVIDDKIRRILDLYNRFGFFENPDISIGYELDNKFVRDVALDAARGGIVLLKNNNLLPLNKNEIKTIAIIGPNGNSTISGGGSSIIDPMYPMTLVEAVKKVGGDNIDVVYEKGIYTGLDISEDIFRDFNFYVYNNGQKVKGVNADFYSGIKLEGESIHSQYFEKLNLVKDEMHLNDRLEFDYSTRFTCYYQPEKTGYQSFVVSGDDGYRLLIDGEMVIENWQQQSETAKKYECKLNAGQEYKIEVEYYQDGGEAIIRLSALPITQKTMTDEYIVNAISVAKKADLVIMSVGHNKKTESEGFDRTFEMPYNQSQLISKIAAVNNNVVVVINAGGNVEMESWIQNVKSLLYAWYPGQEGNLAVAEILFGKTNPSGKLPASFETRLEENPTYNSYWDDDEDLKVFYSEGIFMGYRHYDKSDIKPMFPFGYGLSYTTFEYSVAKTDKQEYESSELVKVSVEITNTGSFDGAEVVQLYISDKKSLLPRPVKELKAFDKLHLKQGESKIVEFQLEKEAFSYYNPETHSWELESGVFDILVGSSSVEIRQSVSIVIN